MQHGKRGTIGYCFHLKRMSYPKLIHGIAIKPLTCHVSFRMSVIMGGYSLLQYE